MYIKSIKMQGFKSFADKTNLDFSKGISAIVGPNGSGKSNVVDAILWVLGEQSVKTLRGDSAMNEVIFSGSKTREGQKKASVAILFDNTDHKLNTDLNEVEVKRVIYSTGENDYFINNVKVRLKDITDLLLDVTSKFNIISQGNINALVENKSSERRILFESAAGVLKYKKRKEESLRKLEGTKENLTRVNLIIKELLTTLTPLEKQKDDAEKYLQIKGELENNEIALIAHDITLYKERFDELTEENKNLQASLDTSNVKGVEKLEKLKLDNLKIQEKIDEKTRKESELINSIADLNSQKQITLERSKYKLDKKTIDNNLLILEEERLNLEKDIDVLQNEISSLHDNLKKITEEYNTESDERIKTKVNISNLTSDLNNTNNSILVLKNKIAIEKENIENNSFLPKSVSSIINNPILKGIHNTIGNVIETNESHNIAIYTALGASSNFVITNTMNDAKKAIIYLKENEYGRATFFPIDTIKSRKITYDIESTLANETGYIGIASDLVKTKKEYQNIIENQLGNVLVVDTIDDLEHIAKIVDYRYKIVSLEGEILFPGGSIAGGKQNKITNRNNLNELNKELNIKVSKEKGLKTSLDKEQTKFELLNENIENLSKQITEIRLTLEVKENNINDLNTSLDNKKQEINGLKDIDNNSIDKSLEKLINDLSKLQKEKEITTNDINDLKNKRFDLTNKIEDEEKRLQKQSSDVHKLENKIQTNEIEVGKLEVKIDNLLNILTNDYNITYEYANNNYSLDMDFDLARTIVNHLKGEMKHLTNVNIGSISEYERLKKRYDFLDKQKSDLESSSSELLKIIEEMDEIMKDKFKKTFDKIASEFTKVFRIMFKGGNGLLKLENSEDLLNTGINILAVPPGKKLNSTAALSGGEKALTAICLIFAILNVNPSPFIVLDEAEAPLDEENVNMFGDYLVKNKDQSQFILITHKKKMMEYADRLYGITMQESGVSKLVSVKFED